VSLVVTLLKRAPMYSASIQSSSMVPWKSDRPEFASQLGTDAQDKNTAAEIPCSSHSLSCVGKSIYCYC